MTGWATLRTGVPFGVAPRSVPLCMWPCSTKSAPTSSMACKVAVVTGVKLAHGANSHHRSRSTAGDWATSTTASSSRTVRGPC
jgi:hypothetical protein